MAQLSRKEVAKWVRDLIISAVVIPSALAYLDMSPVFIVLAGLASLAILSTWEHWDFIRARPKLKGVLGIFFLCIAVGAGYGAISHVRQIASILLPALKPSTLHDPLLAMECDSVPLPTIVPQDGKLDIIMVGMLPENRLYANAGSRVGTPGGHWEWADGVNPWGAHCLVTNFGKAPMFDVQLIFPAIAYDVAEHDNSRSRGKELTRGFGQIKINSLDAGKAAAFSFYFEMADNSHFIEFYFPKTAEYQDISQKAAETEFRSPRYMGLNTGSFALFPDAPKSPPELPNPIPMPPSRPKKT